MKKPNRKLLILFIIPIILIAMGIYYFTSKLPISQQYFITDKITFTYQDKTVTITDEQDIKSITGRSKLFGFRRTEPCKCYVEAPIKVDFNNGLSLEMCLDRSYGRVFIHDEYTYVGDFPPGLDKKILSHL